MTDKEIKRELIEHGHAFYYTMKGIVAVTECYSNKKGWFNECTYMSGWSRNKLMTWLGH